MNVCRLDHAEALPPEVRAAGKKWAIAMVSCWAISPVGMVIGLIAGLMGAQPKLFVAVMLGSIALSRVAANVCLVRLSSIAHTALPRSFWRDAMISCCIYSVFAYFVWSM